jgi:hypothetical protein
MSRRIDLNHSYIDKDKDDGKKDKDDKDDEKKDKKDKDYYKKLIKSHLEKKGKKKYWSNISRKSDTDNDLI